MADILAVQEDIATDIFEKLRLRVTGEEKKRAVRRQTEDPEAYQLYLKGRYYWNQGTVDGYKKSIEYLQRAIAKDPKYAVAYAGMPVTDLVFRLKQKEAPYRELFSVPYHIGKTIDQDPDEYLRRSPIFYADKLRTPLLLHAVANDEDVSPAEVDRLAQAFRQKGKQFQYKVYGNIDPGHAFNKLDTAEARASRLEIYKFFAQFLTPARPLR